MKPAMPHFKCSRIVFEFTAQASFWPTIKQLGTRMAERFLIFSKAWMMNNTAALRDYQDLDHWPCGAGPGAWAILQVHITIVQDISADFDHLHLTIEQTPVQDSLHKVTAPYPHFFWFIQVFVRGQTHVYQTIQEMLIDSLLLLWVRRNIIACRKSMPFYIKVLK